MTAFDIIVLFLIGAGAIFGFMRGFVQEALSLVAWLFVIAAIRLLHGPATEFLIPRIGTEGGAAVLAFLAIMVISWFLGKFFARSIGKKSRESVLGPVDRVLGFGFGALKGLIGATMLFLFIIMAYETLFGGNAKRPAWIADARTYPLLSASGDALSTFVRERRATARNIESASQPSQP
jgi:membrane protein required for colicin V production